AGAAEARHHLVENEQDAVAIAQLANAGQITVGGNDDPVRAGYRFHHDRRDVLWPFILDHLFHVAQALERAGRLIAAKPAAIVVRIEHAADSRNPRLGPEAARIPGQCGRTGGGAVVAAVADDDLRPPCHQPGDPNRVLVGFRAPEGEEALVEIAGGNLG